MSRRDGGRSSTGSRSSRKAPPEVLELDDSDDDLLDARRPVLASTATSALAAQTPTTTTIDVGNGVSVVLHTTVNVAFTLTQKENATGFTLDVTQLNPRLVSPATAHAAEGSTTVVVTPVSKKRTTRRGIAAFQSMEEARAAPAAMATTDGHVHPQHNGYVATHRDGCLFELVRDPWSC